jgi:TRAP-type uncharacterized transport system substrate-binding protein
MARKSTVSHFCRVVVVAIFIGGSVASNTALMAQTSAQNRPSAPLPPVAARQTVDTLRATVEQEKREHNDSVVTILGTGRQGGDTQFAEDVRNVVEGIKGSELRVLPILGKSELSNILDVLQLKGIDMAIVDRDVLVNWKKKNPSRYGDIDKRINYVTKLFTTALHVYAHGNIKSLEDLRGKKISCLKEGSTVAVMCETLFSVFKIDIQIVYDDFETALQKLKTGEIAAAASGASPPIPGFEKVKPEDDLHFVPITAASLPNSDFKTIWATYLPSRLKHDDYPNMIPEGKEVPTIATTSLLAVYAWPAGSARELRTSKFVRLFFENISTFHKPSRHPKWKDVNLATEVRGWTRYPAAQEWLNSERSAAQAESSSARSATNETKMKATFVKFLNEYNGVRGTPATDAQKEALYTLFVKWWETVKKQQQQ